MGTFRTIALVISAGTIVASCGPLGGHKAPKGQVVATVDGKEITQLDLQAEMAGVNTSDPKVRQAAERQALQMILMRRVLADAARKEHMDKSPNYIVQERRATDGLLAQMLQTKQAAAVPAASDDEVRRFVEGHPDMFAQRKVYALDMIRMPVISDTLMKGLQPLNTLDDVDAYLTANKVPHAKGAANLDAMTANPKLVEAISKLPPGEVFIYSANGAVLANRIRDTQISPVPNDVATKYATALLKQQRTQDAISRQVSQLMAQASSKIQYNPAFKPPPAPAAPAGKPAATPAK